MVVVDCKSPISQEILKRVLKESIESRLENSHIELIVTDRDDIRGSNVVNISHLQPPLKQEAIITLMNERERQSNLEAKKDCDCSEELATLKREIFELLTVSSQERDRKIEALFEKK